MASSIARLVSSSTIDHVGWMSCGQKTAFAIIPRNCAGATSGASVVTRPASRSARRYRLSAVERRDRPEVEGALAQFGQAVGLGNHEPDQVGRPWAGQQICVLPPEGARALPEGHQ